VLGIQKNFPEEIRKYYKKHLSNYDIVYKHLKVTYLFYVSIPIYCIGVFLVFYRNGAYSYLSLPLFLPFVLAAILVPRNSRRFLSKQFGFEIKNLLHMYQVIQAHRVKEMKDILYTSNYDTTDKIEDLIEMLSATHERSKFEKLFPYSLLAILMWHIWGEYVGFRFNTLISFYNKTEWNTQALWLVPKLVIVALIIWVFLVLVVSTFRMFLLYKISRDETLCTLLREILHEMKRTEKQNGTD